jgi:3',5'-cyclic AMP phosphodiesterase CpdA
MLDTANGTLGERQWDWYDDILKKTSSDNIFVLSHYSLFDQGTQSAGSWPSNEEKYALIALNTKYKVDYFFSGHLHRYRETLIDDVRYIMLNDLKDGDFNTMLKVTVSESELDCTFVK